MISTSKDANPNYLAQVVQLTGLRKHGNADRLQCVDIDFQTVITGLDAQDGDIYIFFPVESQINSDFLTETNSFRDKTLNADPEKVGFFDEKGRVKAMKLRGEKSMGYIVPIGVVLKWAYGRDTTDPSMGDYIVENVGTEFDTINGIKLLNKYVIELKEQRLKEGKKPKLNRLVEGQVKLHVDTENLRRNAHKIGPNDHIAISYKTHGTSWWVGNLRVKTAITWFEKLAAKLKVRISTTEYDWVYGSRRVVKNANLKDPKAKDHFFGYDLWEGIKEEVKSKVPKGFTVYGEALGYDKNGKYIQSPYDYGQLPGEMRLEVYRITTTNDAGFTLELSHDAIGQFCQRTGLIQSTTFFNGLAKDVIPDVDVNDIDWNQKFIKALEKRFNEKPCFMCKNHVPEEGIVVRKESIFEYEAYKLKSFAFLEAETNMLDAGVIDLETEN